MHKFLIPPVLVCALTAAAPAQSVCGSIDFEDRTAGSVITAEYYGVTFSAVGDSCGGSPTVELRIADAYFADSFDTQVLQIDAGCPSASPDYLRMVFDVPQHDVRFLLGPTAGEYTVRAYATTSGTDGLLSTETMTLAGTGFVDVKHGVRVQTTGIRRIEVVAATDGFEAIDELCFVPDDTAPEVQITAPAPGTCVCSGSVSIRGISCDASAIYESDRLEYLRIAPTVDDDWTFVSGFSAPVCTEGGLYNWNTADPLITDGRYLLRVTAVNDCGLMGSDQIDVIVDKTFDTLAVNDPTEDAVVGGVTCVRGTASDALCFASYSVEYRPVGGATWTPVDPNQITYTQPIVNDTLARWPTAGLTDGDYQLRVSGRTDCVLASELVARVIVDNTPPTAALITPGACSVHSGFVEFSGTAFDENLAEWVLEFWDPILRSWELIATSDVGVTDGVLATWDARALSPCTYAVRLCVRDRATVDNCVAAVPRETRVYVAVELTEYTACCPGDTNGDGFVNFRDIDPFIALQNTTCPTPPSSCCPGDVNLDGFVNFRDIDPFIAVQNTTCP